MSYIDSYARRKVSRRRALSTAGKAAVGAAAVVVIGGVAYTVSQPAATPQTVTKTAQGQTVTTTAQGQTVTQTLTKTIEDQALKGGTIVISQPNGPVTADPVVAWDKTIDGEFVQQFFQSLIGFENGPTPKISPLLAQTYGISRDGLTYTFKIRDGVEFDNGDPLNSYVFWYSIYRCAVIAHGPSFLIPPDLYEGAGITADILNQFNTTDNIPPSGLKSTMSDPNLPIHTPNENEIVFRLEAPFAPFEAAMTQVTFAAVSPNVVSSHGGVVEGTPNEWMTLNAVSTGPYKLTKFIPDIEYVLEKNENYFGGANNMHPTPNVDKIIVKVVPEPLARLQDVSRGTVDITFL